MKNAAWRYGMIVLVVEASFFVGNYRWASAIEPSRFSVVDFGAQGKDATNDTAAFQKAVDACFDAGGGVVQVPCGDFTVGRIVLKDNVTLDLHAGAVVRASVNRDDYPPMAGSPDSCYQPAGGENALSCRYAVLYALGAKNVGLTGRGKLLGDGKKFWTLKNSGDYCRWNTALPQFRYTPHSFRPIMVLFEDCENAVVRDVTIEDSPVYGGWFAGCRYLKIAGVRILNDLAGPNTDGLHFSSCRNVHVSDCDFVCGDDCIAIDPNHRGPSSNFTILGCTFNTTVNVFRIYTGLDPGLPSEMPRGCVTDISASNCTVEDASGVFNITAERGDIGRIAFSNFTVNMDQRGSSFFFMTLDGGRIEDVALSKMTIRTDGIGTISGEGGGRVARVRFDDIDWQVFPRTKLFGNDMPEPFGWAMHHFAPYNLYVRHADDICLHNVRVDWREADLDQIDKIPGAKKSWSCIDCRDVSGLDIVDVVCSSFGEDAAAVRLSDVRDAMIRGCRLQPSAKALLEVVGNSENIRVAGNALCNADVFYPTGVDAVRGVVLESNERENAAE